MTSGVETRKATAVRRPHWTVLAACAVLLPIVVLMVLELGLRVAGLGYSTDLLVPCTVQGASAKCYNLFFAAPFFPAGMVQVPRLYSIPETKAPGTYRIFVLGESAAMGDPDSAYGFSRYLEVMLRERFPSMRFEVVNTGSVAINSHVVLPIAKALAKERPDLFIIYSGNNEVVGPYGAGTVLTASVMRMPVVRVSMFYQSTRIGQFVTRLGTQKQEWRGMELFLNKQVAANSPAMKYVYQNFETNLRETIAVALGAGAKVIVATPATNLKDCAPFASLHREGLKPEDLSAWKALVQQGDQLQATNQNGGALQLYLAAEKIDDQYAELDFRIARCMFALGDFSSAKEHYVRARDLDTLRFRADTRINEINRAAASSFRDRITLVDAEKLLSDASSGGVIDSNLVYEHVHLTPEGNYLLARAMFRQIERNLPSGSLNPSDSNVPSEADCERLLALTRYDRARVAADMLGRLQKPPFTTQLNHTEQLFRWAALAASDEDPNDTSAQYQWAIARNPEDRMLRLKYGMFLYRYNRAAAAQQIALAQPWDGYPVFLPDGTQVR